jgi:uncharacterized protein (DUF1800 family)
MGPAAFLGQALTADPAVDQGIAGLSTPDFRQFPPLGKNADQAAKKARQIEASDQLQQLTGWWLRRMAMAQQPVPEKLTFVWHSHFATAATKVRSAALLLGQNQAQRSEAAGISGRSPWRC